MRIYRAFMRIFLWVVRDLMLFAGVTSIVSLIYAFAKIHKPPSAEDLVALSVFTTSAFLIAGVVHFIFLHYQHDGQAPGS